MVLMLICIIYESLLSMSFEVYVRFEWFCFWSKYFSKSQIDFVLVLILEWLCFYSHYFNKVQLIFCWFLNGFDYAPIVLTRFHLVLCQLWIYVFAPIVLRSNWLCVSTPIVLGTINFVFMLPLF
jgi:hypothetical protein